MCAFYLSFIWVKITSGMFPRHIPTSQMQPFVRHDFLGLIFSWGHVRTVLTIITVPIPDPVCAWSEWGSCSARCGGSGIRIRMRHNDKCLLPGTFELESCNTAACKPWILIEFILGFSVKQYNLLVIKFYTLGMGIFTGLPVNLPVKLIYRFTGKNLLYRSKYLFIKCALNELYSLRWHQKCSCLWHCFSFMA